MASTVGGLVVLVALVALVGLQDPTPHHHHHHQSLVLALV